MTKVRNVLVTTVASLVCVGLIGCSTQDKNRNQYTRRDDDRPLVDDKYSLKADRNELERYRQEVPEDQRRSNDEMALIPQLFQDESKSPSQVREKFDGLVRKKRALFDKDMQKEREKFTNEERKSREQFLKDQKSERDAFVREKPSKERREDFFKEQEDKRKDYFANQREKRDDFESDVRERRKSFEDYVREKQNEFNSEYRSYSKRYDEWKKQKEEERRQRENRPSSFAPPTTGQVAPPARNAEAEALERELNDARSQPGSPLESGE